MISESSEPATEDGVVGLLALQMKNRLHFDNKKYKKKSYISHTVGFINNIEYPNNELTYIYIQSSKHFVLIMKAFPVMTIGLINFSNAYASNGRFMQTRKTPY